MEDISKIRKTRVTTIYIFIHDCAQSQSIKTRQDIKGIKTGKEKLPLFANGTTQYIKGAIDSTRNLRFNNHFQ